MKLFARWYFCDIARSLCREFIISQIRLAGNVLVCFQCIYRISTATSQIHLFANSDLIGKMQKFVFANSKMFTVTINGMCSSLPVWNPWEKTKNHCCKYFADKPWADTYVFTRIVCLLWRVVPDYLTITVRPGYSWHYKTIVCVDNREWVKKFGTGCFHHHMNETI